MKAIYATSFISKFDNQVVTDSPKSRHSLFSFSRRKNSTSLSEESLHCDLTDAYVCLHEEKDKIRTSLLRMIPNPSSPVFTHVESVPLGEDTMNTFQPPTSNHSSPDDTSSALQVEMVTCLLSFLAQWVCQLIKVMDVVYSGASRLSNPTV